MAYFWRCPQCRWLGTFDDDESPQCWNTEHEHDAKHYADAEADLAEEADWPIVTDGYLGGAES